MMTDGNYLSPDHLDLYQISDLIETIAPGTIEPDTPDTEITDQMVLRAVMAVQIVIGLRHGQVTRLVTWLESRAKMKEEQA